MARKFIQHIKNESYVDFVKEVQAILDAEHEKQVREHTEMLLRTGALVRSFDAAELSEASLTRKHFQMAANAVKEIEDKDRRHEMAKHHAEIFGKSNPRFDRKKFMQAAGVEEKEPEQNLNEASATRKHFQMAADSLKAIEDKEKRKQMANHHAELFTKANPRFDRKKFMQAAGVDEREPEIKK